MVVHNHPCRLFFFSLLFSLRMVYIYREETGVDYSQEIFIEETYYYFWLSQAAFGILVPCRNYY